MRTRIAVVVVLLAAIASIAGAATYTVTNTNNSGAGSFRQAILDANASGTASTIAFSIGSGPQTITISPVGIGPNLPPVTVPVVIDGTTQPGYTGTPLITLTDPSSDLVLNETSTVRGMRFANFGFVRFVTANGSVAEDNAGSTMRGFFFEGTSNGRIEDNTCVSCYRLANLDANSDDNQILSNDATNFGGIADFGFVISGDRNLVRDNRSEGHATGDPGAMIVEGDDNVIDDNTIATTAFGLEVTGDGNVVTGNTVYGNATGISVFGTNNTIGGDSAAERNFVYGNNRLAGEYSGGVRISGSGTVVEGNWIGVTAAGATQWQVNGVVVMPAAGANNTIRDNVIAGNSIGILLQRAATIEGNRIGILANGNAAGNTTGGINVSGNGGGVVGGNGAANIIANNGYGITSTANGSVPLTISRNSIYNNTGVGLSIMNAQGQRHPTLTGATLIGGTTTISGTVSGPANATLTIELFDNTACDGSGRGEGRTYVTSFVTNTNGSGAATFSVPVTGFGGGDIVTATSTDPSGNTSEFSNCIVVTAIPAPSIDTIVPNAGRVEGGTHVTIGGANFVSGATVTFGGVAATSVQFVNAARLNVITPAHAAGSVDVVVRNPDTQSATRTNGFTYTSCLKPQITSDSGDAGVMRGSGTTLQVGTEGDGPLSYQWYVEQNGAWVSINGATASTLDVTPNETTSYQVRVTNPCGNATESFRVVVCGAAVASAEPSRIAAGQTTRLSVLADTPTTNGVQWYELRQGTLVAIEGATSSSFATPELQNTTLYVARVATPCGVIESSPVVVTVGSAKQRAVRR
jgi:hypothetical protein